VSRLILVGGVAAGALAACSAGAVALVGHFTLFIRRVGFALDLEWMEGGLLLHAARLAEGKAIYVPPSVDFVPYLYTPLYPALLALLSKLVPLGYLLGRLLSILSFTGALALLVAAAVQAAAASPARPSAPPSCGRSPARAAALALGLGGAGVVAASFAATGGFYDLVRADSLLLLLEAGALFLAIPTPGVPANAATRGHGTAAAAGLLIALAFFTKQTASLVGVSLGLGLLVTSWRRGLVYGGTAAVTLALGMGLLNAASAGWFWTYVFELHQSHAFYARRAYLETPRRLLELAAPLYLAWLAAGLTLWRARALRRSDAIHGAVALGGFASACVGFGTQWAFDNAFIPAFYFPAFSATIWSARLAGFAITGQMAGEAGRRALGLVAMAALAGLCLGLQAIRTGWPDSRRLAPGPADRTAAERFLTHLRSLEGPLFIPFHPYYPLLAGQPPHLHRMGVWDVTALLGRPAGLDEAIAGGRFSHVVLDWKSQPGEWPTLPARYHDIHEFADGIDAVRSFAGAETSPRRLLARTRPPPSLPPGGERLFDFEGGYSGFVADGDAWGVEPAPAQRGLFGRAAADSRRFGPERTGELRSPPIALRRPRLRFTLAGSRDPDLRVLLLEGTGVSHTASPGGGIEIVEWDVGPAAGHTATLIIEDRSPRGGLAVDEVVAF
jgi:hypothetical protein